MGIEPLNFHLQREELELQANLSTWLAHEENQMREKSRESWLQLGDKNTKFFIQWLRLSRLEIISIIFLTRVENQLLILLP